MTFETIKIDVTRLKAGPALDWLVAKAEGQDITPSKSGSDIPGYSSSPALCWPLMKNHQIMLEPEAHNGLQGTEMSERWLSNVYYNGGDQFTTEYVDSPELAVCIARVVMEFGERTEAPALFFSEAERVMLTFEGTLPDGAVLGLDRDGCILQWNSDTQAIYNSGETPATFGIDNLTEVERKRCKLDPQAAD
jgi:hypothetical protein